MASSGSSYICAAKMKDRIRKQPFDAIKYGLDGQIYVCWWGILAKGKTFQIWAYDEGSDSLQHCATTTNHKKARLLIAEEVNHVLKTLF